MPKGRYQGILRLALLVLCLLIGFSVLIRHFSGQFRYPFLQGRRIDYFEKEMITQ